MFGVEHQRHVHHFGGQLSWFFSSHAPQQIASVTEFRIRLHFILPIQRGLVGADQRGDHGGETNRLGQFGFWAVVFALGVEVSRHGHRGAQCGHGMGVRCALGDVSNQCGCCGGWGAGGFEPGIKVCEFLRARFVSDQQQKCHFFKGGIRREIRDFVSAIDQLGLVDGAN